MKYLLLSAALIPLPGLAEQIEMTATVSAVTLYPSGALVTRQIALDLPAGRHELRLTNLPAGTDPNSLRVSASAGTQLGSVNLQTDRLPAPPAVTPEQKAAEARLKDAEEALAVAQDQIDAVMTRARAAEDQAQFLRDLSPDAAGADPIARSRAVRDEIAAALLAAQEATREARQLIPARDAAQEAVTEAEQALAALSAPPAPAAILDLVLESTGAPTQIEISSFAGGAGWQPVYDLHLDRANTDPELRLERVAVVRQNTGEDWQGVDLTLSSARPAAQTAPAILYPWLRRIYDQAPMMEMSRQAAPAMIEADAAYGAKAGFVEAGQQGDIAIWHYGLPVDIRDGVASLHLKLGAEALSADITAEAVPQIDAQAYLVAASTNNSPQPLLPGPVSLWRDGAMVGRETMPMTAPGAALRLGFGPIDGLRASAITPEKSAGENGLISRENRETEETLLRVENQTGRDWPLRILARVPYSEQDALEISYNASPAPDQTNADDQRGILAWNSPLRAGQTREITLRTTLSWPLDQILE